MKPQRTVLAVQEKEYFMKLNTVEFQIPNERKDLQDLIKRKEAQVFRSLVIVYKMVYVSESTEGILFMIENMKNNKNSNKIINRIKEIKGLGLGFGGGVVSQVKRWGYYLPDMKT